MILEKEDSVGRKGSSVRRKGDSEWQKEDSVVRKGVEVREMEEKNPHFPTLAIPFIEV